jgi:hypothetical protein
MNGPIVLHLRFSRAWLEIALLLLAGGSAVSARLPVAIASWRPLKKQAAFRDPHKSLDNFNFEFNTKMNRS